ncbi:MAG TPA: DUF2203 domain-containing protein [Acidimicrobiia bacterium]|nr:DUF2203 domain-containing protein [Acidimicrobiia bacterium]
MRIWTLEEATGALPEVRELVRRLRVTATAVRQRQQRTRGNGASGNGQAHHEADAGDPAVIVRTLLDELTERGIVVRDPERGLIDFPARSPTGRDYLLCYLDGEAAIEWWHWPEAGFSGRTPLSEPPA